VDGVLSALSAGARIDERRGEFAGPGLASPLMAAALGGAAAVVPALLAAGADATLGEKDGYTPLHGAAFQGRAAAAAALLAHARVPNAAHADGFWPLHRACWGRERRHADTVAAFLNAGADHAVRAASGETPLQLCRRSGNAAAALLEAAEDTAAMGARVDEGAREILERAEEL